jgi:diacylglycerol kinase (ATP)
MATSTTAVLVINISSRQSRRYLSEIKTACKKYKITLHSTFIVTKSGTSLAEAMRSALDTKVQLIIVGGGDGTISDAVDYLVNSNVEMGILPLGTTNNFARSIGMPEEIEECIARIKRTSAKKVDLGKVGGEYFANATTIGVSANIAANVGSKQKKYFGRLAYGIVGIKELWKHKPFYVRITDADADMEISMETHQLVIANGRYHAGKAIAADATLTSRELVIFSLGGRSKLSLIVRMIDFYSGRRKSIRHHSYVLGRNIRIETDPVQKVELDGELKFVTPIDLSVAPKSLRIRY